jgi:hypothetical protein
MPHLLDVRERAVKHSDGRGRGRWRNGDGASFGVEPDELADGLFPAREIGALGAVDVQIDEARDDVRRLRRGRQRQGIPFDPHNAGALENHFAHDPSGRR